MQHTVFIDRLTTHFHFLSNFAPMKKYITIVLLSFVVSTLIGCNNSKKLDEVVEVPLPETEVAVVEMGNPADVKVDEGGAFQMVPLPYAYNALEPYIDAKTMEIHFSKHHLGYANNLTKPLRVQIWLICLLKIFSKN